MEAPRSFCAVGHSEEDTSTAATSAASTSSELSSTASSSSLTTREAPSSAWQIDELRVDLSHLGSSRSGRCRFCYALVSISEQGRGLADEEDVLVDIHPDVIYCDVQCRQRQIDLDVGEAMKTNEIKLTPRCKGRASCIQCNRARHKNSVERPCRIHFDFVPLRHKQRPQPYAKALSEMFELFLTFLMKHENDFLKNSTQRLSVILGNQNCPPYHMLQLYVSCIYSLQQANARAVTPLDPVILDKLLGFYNLMTVYHRQLNFFANFNTDQYIWWEAYITNWASFSQWLLTLVFFKKLTINCQCDIRKNTEVPEVLKTLTLPSLDTQHVNKKEKKKQLSLLASRTLKLDAPPLTTRLGDECSVCGVILAEKQPFSPWIEEFLKSKEKRTSLFPCERLCPEPISRPDLLIRIVNEGRLPRGLVCSQHCLDTLTCPEPARKWNVRRLLLCSFSNCSHIVGNDIQWSSAQACQRKDCGQGDPNPLPVEPKKRLNVKNHRNEGCFKNCDQCKVQTVMFSECQDCFSRSYCSDICQAQDKGRHDCARLANYALLDKVLVIQRPLQATWAMVSSDLNLYKALLSIEQCPSCMPIIVQILLTRNTSEEPLGSLPQVLKRVFPYRSWATYRLPRHLQLDQANFSFLHLSTTIVVMQNILKRCAQVSSTFHSPDPRIDPTVFLSTILDTLLDVYDGWRYESNNSSAAEKEFYNFKSMLDHEAILKYTHLFCVCLAVDAALVTVQCAPIEHQVHSAKRLRKSYPIFTDALSMSMEMPVMTLENRTHVFSLRARTLESFSRLFSFADHTEASPNCLNFGLFVAILQGQEPTAQIKGLECRLIITLTLTGWFNSSNKDDFFYLVREFSALVRLYKARPRHLYFQPQVMGNGQLDGELPTTLLQNYLILTENLLGSRPEFVQTLDMLEPLAHLVEENIDTNESLLVDMTNPSLFQSPLHEVVSKVEASAKENMSDESREAFFAPDSSFRRLVSVLQRHPDDEIKVQFA